MSNNTTLTWEEQLQGAERAGVPIVVIRCPDQAAVLGRVKALFEDRPVMAWNVSEGVRGVNQLGQAAADKINAPGNGQPSQSPLIVSGRASEALNRGVEFMPNKSILCMLNIQMFVEGFDGSQRAVIQSIWNCRDAFKSSERMLLLLCPDMKIPPELINDVITIDVPLPDTAALRSVVKLIGAAGGQPKIKDEILDDAASCLMGLSEFQAEQVAAISLRREGYDLKEMRAMQISILEQMNGLTVYRGSSSMDDIGGLDQVKSYCKAKIRGKRKPRLVVLIDEIGDQMAGANDVNGIGGDAQSQLLQSMENYRWGGAIFHGFAGTGKTEVAKAMGCEAGGLFVVFDMGGMKDKWVGGSEKRIRGAVKVLHAMGGSEVFFIGTTNSMGNLTPQMRRRFERSFFFPRLTKADLALIWPIQMKKFGIAEQALPDDTMWTGAEVRNCCSTADEFGVTLIEAAQFITPVIRSMGELAAKMEEEATNKYLSASEPGLYQASFTVNPQKVARRLQKPSDN